MTAAGPGELLTKITIPPGGQDGFAAVTIGRDGTAIVTAAASLNGGARIAIGCVDAVPVRARQMEERIGSDFSDDNVRAAAEGLGATLDPPSRRARVGRLPAASRRGAGGARRRGGEGAALMDPVTSSRITVTVNGEEIEYDVDARRLLVHFLRDDLDLTGTHVGCDTGNCGACTVIYNGVLAKSCMLLAIQADGATIETVESLSSDGELTTLQQSFSDHHALQCGYCTPGMLMSATALLRDNPLADRGARSARRSRATSAAAPAT